MGYLAHLIELYWRLRIYPCDPKDAATTCLLALACRTGEWVVGGIGDGLVATKTGDEPVSRLTEGRSEGFGNETAALGNSPGMKGWQLTRMPPTLSLRWAVLATDGVADDIVTEKVGGFCSWVVEEFVTLGAATRRRHLIRELQAWPTPNHLDDKTVAVLWVAAEKRGGDLCIR